MYLYEENDEKIELDRKYLEELYDCLNQEYFDGKLGGCEIGTFSGRRVRTLGLFKMADGTKCERLGGRMFRIGVDGSKTYVDSDNFVELCKPKILLNANYKWTPDQIEATMLHEMCHYWTFRTGWAPNQAHGTEFRRVAYSVSGRSGGKFDIKRLAGAEELSNLELRSDLQASVDQRRANKSNNTYVVLLRFKSGRTMLSRTSDPVMIANEVEKRILSLRGEKYRTEWGTPVEMDVFKDADLASELTLKGYSTNFRSNLKWWEPGASEVEEISEYPHKTFDFTDLPLDAPDFDLMAFEGSREFLSQIR